MKKSEIISMLLLLGITIYIRGLTLQHSSLDELYSGPSFRNSDLHIIVYYALFSIYTLVLFGKTSTYVSNYGVIILIHSKSINSILKTA